MLAQMSRNWWIFALRGVAAILFGIIAFTWAEATLTFLVLLFGAYFLVDGVLAVIAALTNNAGARRWWVLLEGLVGIAVGILTFIWPGATALTLVYLIAAWAIITGVMEIMAAIELRREISNEWLLILSGLASVAFGVLVIVYPSAGALGIIWLIAAYAILFGVLLLALSFRVRNLRSTA